MNATSLKLSNTCYCIRIFSTRDCSHNSFPLSSNSLGYCNGKESTYLRPVALQIFQDSGIHLLQFLLSESPFGFEINAFCVCVVPCCWKWGCQIIAMLVVGVAGGNLRSRYQLYDPISATSSTPSPNLLKSLLSNNIPTSTTMLPLIH